LGKHEIWNHQPAAQNRRFRRVKKLIRTCILAVLDTEGFVKCAEVSVTFLSNPAMRKANREYRGVDKPTDVLSFPILSFDGEHHTIDTVGDLDFDQGEGAVLLGDIVISLEQAALQAEEFGHSFLREVGYLTVHSMYHLLGYDHRRRNKNIVKKRGSVLTQISLPR
jgi:probable rRNA maturation factor